jgi:hypothetical protein
VNKKKILSQCIECGSFQPKYLLLYSLITTNVHGNVIMQPGDSTKCLKVTVIQPKKVYIL